MILGYEKTSNLKFLRLSELCLLTPDSVEELDEIFNNGMFQDIKLNDFWENHAKFVTKKHINGFTNKFYNTDGFFEEIKGTVCKELSKTGEKHHDLVFHTDNPYRFRIFERNGKTSSVTIEPKSIRINPSQELTDDINEFFRSTSLGFDKETGEFMGLYNSNDTKKKFIKQTGNKYLINLADAVITTTFTTKSPNERFDGLTKKVGNAYMANVPTLTIFNSNIMVPSIDTIFYEWCKDKDIEMTFDGFLEYAEKALEKQESLTLT